MPTLGAKSSVKSELTQRARAVSLSLCSVSLSSVSVILSIGAKKDSNKLFLPKTLSQGHISHKVRKRLSHKVKSTHTQ